MFNENLSQTLIDKYKKNKLAHLYQITTSKNQNNSLSLNWTIDLVEKILSFEKQLVQLKNHHDVTILRPEAGAKSYTAESLQVISEACHFRANELSQKFIIIDEAEKISDIQANKLLKIFEEPPIPVTIFLVNTSGKKLLNTISSRCIKVILTQQLVKPQFDLKVIKNLSFTEFINKVEKENYSIQLILSALIQAYNYNKDSYDQMDMLQEQIKLIEQDILYNNSSQYILLKIHHSLGLL